MSIVMQLKCGKFVCNFFDIKNLQFFFQYFKKKTI